MHFFKNGMRDVGQVGVGRIGSQKSTAHAKVENQTRFRSKIFIRDRSKFWRIIFKPADKVFVLRNCLQTARSAKCVVRETRMNGGKALECVPCRSFRDGNVWI